jgi:hypothetical protein
MADARSIFFNNELDGDGLGDGQEQGRTYQTVTSETDLSVFIPDADPSSTTHAYETDTDLGGVPDGWIDGWQKGDTTTPSGVPDMEFQWGEGEDKNFNGKCDPTETDPTKIDTDQDG